MAIEAVITNLSIDQTVTDGNMWTVIPIGFLRNDTTQNYRTSLLVDLSKSRKAIEALAITAFHDELVALGKIQPTDEVAIVGV